MASTTLDTTKYNSKRVPTNAFVSSVPGLRPSWVGASFNAENCKADALKHEHRVYAQYKATGYTHTHTHIYTKNQDTWRDNKDDENYDEIYYLLHRFSLNNETELEKKFTLRNSLLSKLEWLKENEFRNYEKLLENVKVVRSFVKKNKIRPYLLKNSPLSFFKIVGFIKLPPFVKAP